MKKLFFALFITYLTISTTAVVGQTKSTNVKTEQEIKTLLCKKWKITHMEAEGKRFPVPPEMSESYVTFQQDGSFTEVEEGNTFNGRWTYDHKTKTINTDDKDGKESHKVLTLTTELLILKSNFQGMNMNLVMKSVR